MGRRRDPKPLKVTITRYVDAVGKRCAKDHPGARKVREKSDTYYAQLPGSSGKNTWVSLKTTDIGAAWAELTRILESREREAAGLKDPVMRHARRPIEEHVADWLMHLRAAGRTGAEQIALVGARVRELVERAGWKRLAEVDQGSATRALAEVQATRRRGMSAKHAGRSSQTRNHYLRAVKQWVTWCVGDQRLARDPLTNLQAVNVAIDRRRVRRIPADGEVFLLFSYLEGEHGPSTPEHPLGPATRCRMSGAQRALGYRVAMATGLRADELRSLDAASFDFSRGTLEVDPAYAKARRETVVALPAWLAEEVRAWLAAGGGLWTDFPANNPGRVLRDDLQASGIAYLTADGHWDFHAMRHWYCTWAASQPGISPKTLQTLARHSDPRLTLKVYAQPLEAEVRRALEGLPRPGGPQT